MQMVFIIMQVHLSLPFYSFLGLLYTTRGLLKYLFPVVSSSLCFKFLIISTLRYRTHLKFIVLQLCFCFREQSQLLNNSFFSSGLKFTPLHIEFLCVLGSVSGISVLVHGPATATLWRHSWKESCLLVLSYVSGHSISAPPLAGPPALPTPPPPQLLYHDTLSCSVLVHFPISLPSRSHPVSWL